MANALLGVVAILGVKASKADASEPTAYALLSAVDTSSDVTLR